MYPILLDRDLCMEIYSPVISSVPSSWHSINYFQYIEWLKAGRGYFFSVWRGLGRGWTVPLPGKFFSVFDVKRWILWIFLGTIVRTHQCSKAYTRPVKQINVWLRNFDFHSTTATAYFRVNFKLLSTAWQRKSWKTLAIYTRPIEAEI